MRLHRLTTALAGAAMLATWPAHTALAADAGAVLESYADIAEATYDDSLVAARALERAVQELVAAPSAARHDEAKAAWLAARVPYQQTEVYRFGNPAVDEWEGKVNAWPLDEGLIDYVDVGRYGEQSEENPFYTANVVANSKLTVAGREVDASEIDAELLRSLHEIDEVEANVATGYHAVEFLLWGQDLNGTGPGAGKRPWTDYAAGGECTGGHCDRRGGYLSAAASLLVSDLEEMTRSWGKGGAARGAVTGGEPRIGLAAMLTGMGSLSYGELAGERMKLGLMLHDPEEEHDCFSDNTHNSHYYDALGIRNVYLGRYLRTSGQTVEGASLSDLVRARDPALDDEMKAGLDATMAAMERIRSAAERDGTSYDQQIAEGNAKGNAMVQAAIDALVAQTRTIERIIVALDLGHLELEGSDSLDNPSAVFK